MDKISIAKVLKPKGLKGEMKCLSLTENTELFNSLEKVFVDGVEYKVQSSVFRLGYAYICLNGIEKIEDAEKFRNKIMYIEKDSYGILSENTYFIEDLMGLQLINERGEILGEILEIENYGAADIIIVKNGFLIYSVPFLKDIFGEVDLKNNKIYVNEKKLDENKI